MPSASLKADARAVPCFPPSPASRCVPAVPRKGAPPRESDATGPGLKASSTVGAIRNGAAAPAAPATGDAGGRRKSQAFARPAADAGRKAAAPSASPAARQGAHSTAAAMPCGAPPAAACAATSPRSEACRVAAGASHWRRSASRPSERAPSARNGTQGAGRRGYAWIVRFPSSPLRAVRAAHIVPIPARPSVTWWRSGHRRSP